VQGKLSADQTISNGTDTVVQFIDDFDPRNWYNASTYQLTPSIAGYYHIAFGGWMEPYYIHRPNKYAGKIERQYIYDRSNSFEWHRLFRCEFNLVKK